MSASRFVASRQPARRRKVERDVGAAAWRALSGIDEVRRQVSLLSGGRAESEEAGLPVPGWSEWRTARARRRAESLRLAVELMGIEPTTSRLKSGSEVCGCPWRTGTQRYLKSGRCLLSADVQ